MLVKEILDDNREVKFVQANENDSVYSILKQLDRADVGAAVVRDNDGEVVGIFSERDYARKIVLEEKSSRFTKVKEVMVPRVIYVTPEFTLEECLSVMTEKKIRNLPVIENRRLVAILPMERIVKKLLSQKEYLIEELTKYVTGSTLSDREKKAQGLRFFIMEHPRYAQNGEVAKSRAI